MYFDTCEVAPLMTNCYLLGDEEAGVCAVVDPGGSLDALLRMIDKSGLTPTMILLTHGHYDHVRAVPGLLEKYPEATIMVMTPLHRSTEAIPNMHGKVLKDYVDMIRRAAEYYSLPVLDLYALSGIQPAVPVMKDKYMPDGLHPNDAGHVLLTNRIVKFIESL